MELLLIQAARESVLQSRQNLSRQNCRFVLTSPALNPDVTTLLSLRLPRSLTNNDNIIGLT